MTEGKGEEDTKVGSQPIGLTEGGKDAVLDILNPGVFVDAKVLGDGVDGDKCSGDKRGVDDLAAEFDGKMGVKNEVKEDVTDKREKATVEAGVVAKERSVRVNGVYGGDGLGEKKDEQWDGKGSFFEEGRAALYPANNVGGGDEDGDGVDKIHFG